MSSQDIQINQQVFQLVEELIEKEKLLRQEHQVESLKLLQNQLLGIRGRLTEHLPLTDPSANLCPTYHKDIDLQLDEMLVYVYLFNAQGLQLSNWIPMFSSDAALKDYPVNRPIYVKRRHVEALINSKADPVQHGYLIIKVNKDTVDKTVAPCNDNFGNPLYRLKSNALSKDKIVGFYHHQHLYLWQQGKLVPPQEDLSPWLV